MQAFAPSPPLINSADFDSTYQFVKFWLHLLICSSWILLHLHPPLINSAELGKILTLDFIILKIQSLTILLIQKGSTFSEIIFIGRDAGQQVGIKLGWKVYCWIIYFVIDGKLVSKKGYFGHLMKFFLREDIAAIDSSDIMKTEKAI